MIAGLRTGARRAGMSVPVRVLLLFSQRIKKPVRAEVLSSEEWAMVRVNTPTEKRGSGVIMAGKSPRGSTKKEAKLSIKDKRAQKRAKLEDTGFIKPRKGQ
ncbi:hypothetical protein AB0O95_07910 [Rhodoglobus sp. NPDC076762]